MSRVRWTVGLALTLIACEWGAGYALAYTAVVTRSDGYRVTLTGPDSARVGVPASYTASCGPAGFVGPCSFGEFRAFGGIINRLGEGFGRGAMGNWTPRAAGTYSIRYRLGMTCGRSACPIDVFLSVSVAG